MLLQRLDQTLREPLSAILLHHAEIGDQSEPVGIGSLRDIVVLPDPADGETGKVGAAFGDQNRSMIRRRPGFEPVEIGVGDLRSGQPARMEPTLVLLQLDDGLAEATAMRLGRRPDDNGVAHAPYTGQPEPHGLSFIAGTIACTRAASDSAGRLASSAAEAWICGLAAAR